MSSVTRFIRQVPVSASVLNAAVVAAAPATLVYEFFPSASNIVGNYPPGYVAQAGSGALFQAIQQAVNAAGGAGNLVLRDLGKTILAPIGSASGNLGFFRQVQLLAPSALSASQGFNGGSAGSSFGVLGAANSDYLSFYIPSNIAGVNGNLAAVAGPLLGQM
jgi:hypothetical protein